MALDLSSAEVAQLSRAIHLLVTPLDFETVDDWRSAVNRQLGELLCADSAGFLLPVEEGLVMFSEEHDPDELARYPDYPPPPMVDGTPMWEGMIENEVGTLANWYGDHYDLYTNSVYYNEYSGANGAHDTLFAACSLGGTDARSMASLHFWHERPDGRLFGEREVELMRLMFPAFRAGAVAQVRWGMEREDLLRTIDQLEKPALVADLAGRVCHVSPDLERLIETDPEGDLLKGEVCAAVHELRGVGGGQPGTDPAPRTLVREIATATARYRICGCLYGQRLLGESAFVVVGIERLTPEPLTGSQLRAAFGLTRAEARVAILLSEGKSNKQIAAELCVTEHTARRHTERILLKTGARSRAEVVARLYARPAP
jgi:DNA-binding CsgD family transcriptional regulator